MRSLVEVPYFHLKNIYCKIIPCFSVESKCTQKEDTVRSCHSSISLFHFEWTVNSVARYYPIYIIRLSLPFTIDFYLVYLKVQCTTIWTSVITLFVVLYLCDVIWFIKNINSFNPWSIYFGTSFIWLIFYI